MICKITHATRKNMHGFIGPVLEDGRLKSIKTICVPSYLPAHGEFETLCFVFVASTV